MIFENFGGVKDSTNIEFIYGKSEKCLASLIRHKAIHGESYNSIEELLDAAREEYAVSQVIEEATALYEAEELPMTA